MGCVQGNIPFYEKGREIPVSKAKRLIAFAQVRGLALTLEHVYGDTPLPQAGEELHPGVDRDVLRMQAGAAPVEAKEVIS